MAWSTPSGWEPQSSPAPGEPSAATEPKPDWRPPAGAPAYGPPVYGPPGWAPPMYAHPRETPSSAITGLVLGIVGIAVCSVIGWLPGGVALYLATQAKRQIDADPMRYEGRGIAVAGQVTGAISIGLGVLYTLFIALFVVIGFMGSASGY